MKKDDLIILLIALLLLAGMFYTIFFGGAKSRHGVGLLRQLHEVQSAQIPNRYIVRNNKTAGWNA